MPCDYEIDLENRLVRVRLWGVLIHSDVTAARLRITKDPAFRPDLSQVYDMRDVTRMSTSGAEIQEIASYSVFGPGSRGAFVAPRDTAYGFARMFASYREATGGHEQIEVFRSLEAAEEWLGLKNPGSA